MSHQDAFPDIRPVPPEVRLSWPKPNYINPERRGPALVIINSLLLPLAIIVVGLRLYTRLIIVRSAALDDLFIALALLPAIGLTISVCLAADRYSWDVHIWDMPPKHIIPARQVTFVAQFLFVWATNLTKISILLFYRRMCLPGIRKALHYSVWATMVFVVCYTISITIGLITACSPVRSFWDVSIQHHCINERVFEVVAAILNIFLDFVIILLPLPTVWGLRLPKKQKRALIAVFMLGFFVCVVGVIRVYYVDLVVNKTFDVTWEGFILWIFVALEVDVALICASAPTLKPLFRRYLESTTTHSNTHGIHPQPAGAKTPGGNDIEAGIPVELGSIGNAEGDVQGQKQVPKVPWSKFNDGVKKQDSESEESVWVLEQAEGAGKKPSEKKRNKGNNGERCQVLNFCGVGREPWSGV